MKEKRALKPGTGIATILLIFVVLAMSILSVLSYLKVIQNHQTVLRETEYVQSYAKANAQAQLIQSQVRDGHLEQVQTIEDGYTYTVDVINGQKLLVELDGQGNARVWKTVYDQEDE